MLCIGLTRDPLEEHEEPDSPRFRLLLNLDVDSFIQFIPRHCSLLPRTKKYSRAKHKLAAWQKEMLDAAQ